MITFPTNNPCNTPAEIDALTATCQRLQGFDDRLTLESVDGMLCALGASPRQLPPAEWLPLLFDDSFERAFGDPEDHAQALRTLQARLRVLCAQLDPEALFDDPEALRLDPFVMDWSDEAKAKIIAETSLNAEQARELDAPVTGGEWAEAFLYAVGQLGALWTLPAHDDEAQAAFDAAFAQIRALTLLPGDARYAQHLATYYPPGGGDRDAPASADEAGSSSSPAPESQHAQQPQEPATPQSPPTRDDLLAEACLSVQDLRMHWVDFAPKTQTIRVEDKPGRNDPCPCGSGKKYKKCHGAVA